MKQMMEKLERLLEMGGTKKDVALLAVSGVGEHKMALYGKVFLEEISKFR